MTIDFTTIPLFNLITLVIGVIIIAIIAKKMGFTKIGAIEIDQSGQAANALVLRHLDDIDSNLHSNVWRMTQQMAHQFVFPSEDLCYFARRTLMECVLNPMQYRASSNHFTHHLCPASNRKQYKKDILASIHDYYIDAMPSSNGAICKSTSAVPEWEEVKPYYERAIDMWLIHLTEMVSEACWKKVNIYVRALGMTNNNKYWKNVFQECKEKNESYINELRKRDE